LTRDNDNKKKKLQGLQEDTDETALFVLRLRAWWGIASDNMA